MPTPRDPNGGPRSHSHTPLSPSSPPLPAHLAYPSAQQFRWQMKCSSVHGILIFAANLTIQRAGFRPPSLSFILPPSLSLQLSLSSCRSLANQFNVRHFAAKWEIFEISSKIRCVPRESVTISRLLGRGDATICCSGELAALRYFPLWGEQRRASRRGRKVLSETHLNVNFRRVACP